MKQELPATKILILEPFLLKVGAGNARFRALLNQKIDIIRDVAKDYADGFIPLDGILQSHRLQKKDEELLADGVHPADAGHAVIAENIVAWVRQQVES